MSGPTAPGEGRPGTQGQDKAGKGLQSPSDMAPRGAGVHTRETQGMAPRVPGPDRLRGALAQADPAPGSAVPTGQGPPAPRASLLGRTWWAGGYGLTCPR